MTKLHPMPEDFKETFGEEAEAMRKTLAALASLISVYDMYLDAPEGSRMEQECEDEMEKMLVALIEHPSAAMDILPAMMNLIRMMRTGQSYIEHFARAGIEVL
jgi:hypothetical protein